MLLKSIEIRGFKSFADKTELTFKKGVTAIVGPNGSGKSNISDSVRWVLGEQSVKSLRGGKMEDVIFAGTQFRKPVSLAQVALTLDNNDQQLPLEYSDVTISRRIYRSGESEYYINNTRCRLKDIQELFMDTGIGKEGYSIIGQGKIDAILSGKPEERRKLLEEAAGIVKFKTRKDEAEKKLDNTEQNLVRINDILSTYEERLDPLKAESEKAKEFVKLSEELKLKEVSIIVHSIENVKNKIKLSEDVLKGLKGEFLKLNNEKNEYRAILEKWNKKLEDIENKISNEKRYYYDKKSECQNTESEVNILKERVSNLTSQIEENSNELKRIKSKIEELNLHKENQNKNFDSYIKEQISLNENINQNKNLMIELSSSIEEKESLIKKLKNDQIDSLSNIANIKNDISLINNNIDSLNSKLETVKTSCEGYIHSVKINLNTKEMIEKNIVSFNNKIKDYDNEIKRNKLEISKINSLVQSKEIELKKLNNSYSKMEAKHHLLVNLDKQYEGYNRSVKTLMQHISNGKINIEKDNVFVLGEVIEVDKKFELAMEIALGGAISNIITLNESVAKFLIKYLKNNSIGRATFLPLNIIKGKKISIGNNIKDVNGYIGIASELIKYNSKFNNAVDYVLGRTIICTNMDSALNIAKKSNYIFKIVTLTGEVVNPGGSLTGGSVYNNSSTSIIGRKREIEDLKSKVLETGETIDRFNKSIDENRAILKELDNRCLNLKDQIYYENIEITKLKEKLESIHNENDKLRKKLDISRNEVELINKNLKASYEELDNKKNELKEKEDSQGDNVNYIGDLEINLKNKIEEINALREKLTEHKVKKAQVDEVVLNYEKEKERLKLEIEELTKRHNDLEKSIKAFVLNKENSMKKINKNLKHIDEINKIILELEKKFKENEIDSIKIKNNIKINESKVEEINILINKKENDMHKCELNLTKFETEKHTLDERLLDEAEMTFEEALKVKVNIEDVDVYKKQINFIKNKISSLGVVNVGAIEEYKEIKEKYTFMNNQREDLIKAKEELVDVILEMTGKMKSVFNENFVKLKEYFNETFKELFKGGSADLILSSGDELSGNIDITVQPPGKKLQNINLMSGGEKVLSAIALLFSILKMKPTPFCILDEIEAALDDANVIRYSEFLKKFSQNIQFIVITHRKGTMEASDVLYGVTMEEKGISKVVSVDLSK